MLNKKYKVLFITSLFSPFQLDMAYEINKNNLFEYYILFTIPYSSKRGKHWMVKVKKEYEKFIIISNDILSPREQAIRVIKIIEKIKPKIVILGSYKGSIYREIIKSTKRIDAMLALWDESPNLLYPKLIIKLYKKLILKKNLKNFRFVMGIGDRAIGIYKEIFSGDIFLIPYAQDLSLHFSIRRSQKANNEKVIFLFSGQLSKRHNIKLIAKVLVTLYKQYPNKFKFVVAGYGIEESHFWNIIKKRPGLEKQIICDREYKTWEDRVKPFFYSDVLVYPSKYSGWGLVIPEAMASGIAVITTYKVEAARYYIKDGVNGIFIEPTFSQLYSMLEWCIKNKGKVYKIGQQARIAAKKGTAIVIAKKFCNIINGYLLDSLHDNNNDGMI